MPAKKVYADTEFYEKKLAKVTERLGVEKYDWDYSRTSCWVEFFYKGQMYRFEHSIENAQAHGQKLSYGSDAFAQVVLALEDLARIVERGIYDLSSWVAGMKALPKPVQIPDCFLLLGFDHIPAKSEAAAVKKAYREKAQVMHPDKGGSDKDFAILSDAYEQAMNLLGE